MLKPRGSNGATLMMINITVEIPWGHQPGASRQPQQKGKHWQGMATCFTWSEMTKNKISPWRKTSEQAVKGRLGKATSPECPPLVHILTTHHTVSWHLYFLNCLKTEPGLGFKNSGETPSSSSTITNQRNGLNLSREMTDRHEQVFPATILSILKILGDIHRLGR